MIRRTTIEIDEDLLRRAKKALGVTTARAAVDEALRQAADTAEEVGDRRAAGQRRYLARLGERVDGSVLSSEDMWR